MSQENVEVVRRARTAYDGKDMVPMIREVVERLGPDPPPAALRAHWEQEPFWQDVHSDIEWDTSATGALGTVARGMEEVNDWWRGLGASLGKLRLSVDRGVRDLGEWVLAPVDVTAQGRGGIPVNERIFELYRLRDGKIAAYRSFLSEQLALEAVGLRE